MNKDSQELIKEECDRIKKLLLLKSMEYGDSALHPVRIFSKVDSEEGIKVRIDDKLSRIAYTGGKTIKEDTLDDLIGYLVLLQIRNKITAAKRDWGGDVPWEGEDGEEDRCDGV